MKILGIDEAGRGPVIGPLIVGAALIEESKHEMLRELGVKDSKLLSQKRRQELASVLNEQLDAWSVAEVGAKNIDGERASGINLNEIEVARMADLINEHNPDKVYIDSPDINPRNVHTHLKKYLRVEPEIIVEHKADLNYPIVSAASIFAKVRREERMEELRQEYKNIGSGYPSDPLTQTFLKDWFKVHKSWPDFVRQSWSTIAQLEGTAQQKSLGEFK